MSRCSHCAECIEIVGGSLQEKLRDELSGPDAADSSMVAAVFGEWCAALGADNAICSTIRAAIVFSVQGNLARRPGEWPQQHQMQEYMSIFARLLCETLWLPPSSRQHWQQVHLCYTKKGRPGR
jgi:hypothetical protein